MVGVQEKPEIRTVVSAPLKLRSEKAAYRDFLALWNDADPDIPILKEAKGEFAKLQ
jgi:hypothetical protein